MRLSWLCVTDKGRPSRLAFHDHGVRAAILVDLALARRIGVSQGQVGLDTTPTGMDLADKMLAWIARNRDLTVGAMIARGPGSVIDVLLPGASRRQRAVQSRFLRVPTACTAAQREAIVEAFASPASVTPRLAALTVLACALRLADGHDCDAMLRQGGPGHDVLREAVTYLDRLRAKFDYVVSVGRQGTGAGGW